MWCTYIAPMSFNLTSRAELLQKYGEKKCFIFVYCVGHSFANVIFEGCLSLNSESCRSKRARYTNLATHPTPNRPSP